jgi:hypothetical protein
MRKSYLIGAVALFAIGVGCSSGGDDDDAAAPAAADPAATTAAKAKPKKAAAGIGDPVRDGKFEFTVAKMDCSKKKVGDQYLSTTAQGKFCLVTLTVKNVGDEAQLFDSSSQKALDASSTAYDADGGAAMYVNKNAETFLNNINPGNQVKGVIPFDVPKSVTITTLELHDSPFSGGVKVKVG